MKPTLSASLLAAMLLLFACGDGDPMFERKEDVDRIAERLGAAVGADELNASAHHRRTEPGCAAILDLPPEEAWYERNSFSIADHQAGGELYADLVAHLRDEGYVVTELVAPLSGSRGIRAIRDDVGILVDLAGDGANVTVTAGPCAEELSPIGERYEVVD